MGEAAKISLKAIGKQDTFLLSKIQTNRSLIIPLFGIIPISESITEVVLLGNQVTRKQIGHLTKP